MTISNYWSGGGNEDQPIRVSDQTFTGEGGGSLNDSIRRLADRTPKCKFDATAAPTASDDTDSNYAVGSRWIDVTNDKAYVCVDATSAAAVWVETSVVNITSINDVDDVTLGTLNDGDVLVYDATSAAFVNLPQDTVYGQMPLVMCGVIQTTTDLFKLITGCSFKYRLPVDATIISVNARQGTVDSGASQAQVDVVVNAVSVLTAPITLSGTTDTDVAGTVDGVKTLTAGDVIEIDITEGTNGDAEDLVVDIVYSTGG